MSADPTAPLPPGPRPDGVPTEVPASRPAGGDDDDARTVVAGTSAGPGPGAPAGENPLPVGHVLQEYVIEGLVGEGGFGIVYLARDTQLGRVVALKEYMPSSLATRTRGGQVTVRSERQRDTFELGRRSFVNEAQLLAAFDQPSLVKVYRFWEQNGTAYMVMPYYQGPTLKQWLLANGAPTEAWLLALLAPVVDALEVMHHNRCYHRDIAPDNILLLQQPATQVGAAPSVRPVLLDFGAARRVISDATQALTVILKPGYAPIEQYAESSSMKQGAWTDVYALCAVLYAAVTGRAPTPSVSRIVSDELVPAVQAGAGRYSPAFLAVIDAGLAVRPDQRPQDMAALRAMLRAVAGPTPDGRDPGAAPRPEVDGGSLPTAPLAGGGHRPAALAEAKTEVLPPRAAAAAPGPAPAPRPAARTPWLAGGALALALAAGGAWWLLGRGPAPNGAGTAAVSLPSASAAGAAPSASATPDAAGALVAPAPATAVEAGASAPVAPAAVPFTVVGALQDIVRQADPLLGVNVLADKSRLAIGRDRLQFRVKSKEAGYLYVFLSGTDKRHFYLLFPNQLDQDNRIAANTEVVLPRKRWAITAGGPPGTNHLVTLVSRQPRDFADVGLRGAGDEIPEIDLAQAERVWAARRPGENPFVGRPVCEPAAPCDAGFGASLLEVDEVARGRQ